MLLELDVSDSIVAWASNLKPTPNFPVAHQLLGENKQFLCYLEYRQEYQFIQFPSGCTFVFKVYI